MTIEEAVAGIKQHTSLSEGTILELLNSGWSYVETFGEPIRWEKKSMVSMQWRTTEKVPE